MKKIEEEQEEENEEDLKIEEENNISFITPIKSFRKMRTRNLSSFPDLISLKENPQAEKMEEKKDFDKKFWVPDEDAQNCYNCGSKFFSLFNRKHHCRVCGNIFCKSCIDTFFEITIFNEKQELKVCGYCQEKKRELNIILKNNLIEYDNENGNKMFKTKTWDYAMNKKKNTTNLEKFCGFLNPQSKLLREFHSNLEQNYELLLEKMINRVLKEKTDNSKFPNLVKDWGKIIFHLTKKVINNLSPTFQSLNDSININDYLKVKTLLCGDKSKCEVIDGYAMRKNVCHKNMQTTIKNPKILLLKGPLEGYRTNRGESKITNITKSSAIEAYIEIIRKKIDAIKPNIIIVEDNISQKFQNFFSKDKMNISVVTKVNLNKLNNIARCVNSFVVPSPDVIGNQIVLGSCEKFSVQKIKKNISIETKNNLYHMKSEDYHLMKFEGCKKILFNTIILSGANESELKELKRLIKVITRTARYLYCQKFLLKYFNMYYEPSLSNNKDDKNEKNRINNTKRKSSIYREQNYVFGFDTELIDERSNEFECIYMNLQNKNKADLMNASTLRTSLNPSSEIDKNMSINNNMNTMSLKESQVLKSVPNQCSACSYTMNAYSVAQDEERTLGQNIISFLEESKEKCEKCGDIKLNHTSFIYKDNGRIKISLYNLNDQINLIDKIAEYLGFNENSNLQNANKKKDSDEDDIYSYGFCEICNQIVTPLVKLPEEILNFSATKFYQNILYNKKLINFGDESVDILNFIIQKDIFDLNQDEDASYKCKKLKHLHYRDISRIFMTKNGVVKFRYEEVVKYKLLGSQINTLSEYYNKYNKENKRKEIALDKSLTLNALESIKSKLLVHKNIVENMKSESFINIINNAKKLVDDGFERIEELKKINDQIFNENEYENIFVYNTNMRKYLVKIMNMKIISNKLLKGIRRILKLIFLQEADEINKRAQDTKIVELSPKNSNDESNNNPINSGASKIINEIKKNGNEEEKENKETELSNEMTKEEINNKYDLSLKNALTTSSLPNDSESKINLSNSSSISDDENNDEDDNQKDLSDKINREDKLLFSDELEMNIKDEQKEKSKNKLDLSLKLSFFSSSLFNSNPELKEQLNAKYNSFINEVSKYITNILELEKNEYIQKIINKLYLYDKNHSFYSADVKEDDICSLITYALTSDQYLDAVKFDTKNGLNEIKTEFINNDISNDVDNDLFCETSLLYDRDKVKFKLDNLTNEKIAQTLENELISNENKTFSYEVKYNPFSLFNEVFQKKAKKISKNTNTKINYSNINQSFYSMNTELKSMKKEIKKIIKEKLDDICKRFSFPKMDNFQEKKLPITDLKISVHYAKHFEAFRILYGASYFDYLHSIIKSQEWSSVTGGKSKAHFFKSWDEKFVVKCLSELEFNMFIKSCFHYFVHNNKYFFFKMPSSLVKVVGAYRIKIASTKKTIIYCVVMENLNYLISPKNANIITYDLKGSELNRYIKNKENGRVLMDTNFVEDFGGEPLVLDQKIYTLLLCAIKNDTKICRNMDVIDYSLLCIIIDYKEDENKENNNEQNEISKIVFKKGENEENVKYIRLGVLDYFRKYTSDKQFETLFKTIVNLNTPTVINPKNYNERFLKKLSSYFIGS